MGTLSKTRRRKVLGLAVAVGLAAAPVTLTATANAQPAPLHGEAVAEPGYRPTLAMTPGAPPPQVVAQADREILTGMLLVVFAGMAGVTLVMWRDLAKRMNR